MPEIRGLPEPTSMNTWPVADAAAELVTVKAISNCPACDGSGVQANRPDAASKLAPLGISPAMRMSGSPDGSLAATVKSMACPIFAKRRRGNVKTGADDGRISMVCVRDKVPS
jgi:hypothetical protein